ncbi:MAG: LpxI family protein [Xanthobacteraceae bacterium]
MSLAGRADDSGPLGILCGGGSIPASVAEVVTRSGRDVVLFALVGWADPAFVEKYRHYWIHIGRFGEFARIAAKERCRDIVFVGTLVRPSLSQVRLDWATVKMFPRIMRAFRGGDDHLLTGVGRIFEDQGFRLRGAHEVAPEILIAEGSLGKHKPSARDQGDIARGLAVLAAIGSFDIGQAAVVADGNVVALEAAEGTDQMLARVAELRRAGRIRLQTGVGVLVKAPKPAQDRRFDLPAIGPPTIEGVAKAGLAGIAVVAGAAIAAEPVRIAQLADSAGVFVVGVRPAS